ncbi:MAG: hypothetical protein IJY39_09465 [Clostridia bacterium]|nr:hypothetical protein [Clostridia bacterium]
MATKKEYLKYLSDDNLLFIENEYLRLGANLSLGGALTYLSEKGKENLINNYDWGRQVQMSFYSHPVPHLPEGIENNPGWDYIGWNPIQSGDCFRNRSDILDYYKKENEIYIKSVPRHWPLNNCKGECTFEVWYRLDGKAVKVTSRLNNARSDKTLYGARGQELPALYTNATWYKLVSYVDTHPFTGGAIREICNKENGRGWPWESFFSTESWAALVDDDGYGLGIYNGQTNRFAGGFYGEKGVRDPIDQNTGYITPSATEILDHDIVYTYDYLLIVGTVDEIRKKVYEVDDPERRRKFSFEKTRDHFYYKNITDKGLGNQDCLDFDFDKGGMLCSPHAFVSIDRKKILIDAIFEGGEIAGTATVQVLKDGLDSRGRIQKSVDFKLNGDGERRLHEIDMSGIDSAYVGVTLEFASAGHARIYSFEFAD